MTGEMTLSGNVLPVYETPGGSNALRDGPVGFVLPLAAGDESEGEERVWRSCAWPLPQGRVHAVAGDSPLGLRLPLASLPATLPVRTALTVELRNGHVAVFLPPVARVDDSLQLIAVVEDSARTTGKSMTRSG